MARALTKNTRQERASVTPIIPANVQRNPYWRGVLHLFTHHSKLHRLFTDEFFTITSEDATMHISKLRTASTGWSSSEKIMLQLAFHLYNERNKFNLSDLGNLDSNNLDLAFKAMQLRFQRG